MKRSIVIVLSCLLGPAGHAGEPTREVAVTVPAAMRGTWGKNGRCDIAFDRLTITADMAGWDQDCSGPVSYSPRDKAVFWKKEYETDDLVPGGHPDVIVHNTEGFHMPGQDGHARCGPALARVPWPPKPHGKD